MRNRPMRNNARAGSRDTPELKLDAHMVTWSTIVKVPGGNMEVVCTAWSSKPPMAKSSWPSPPDEVQNAAQSRNRLNRGGEAMPDLGNESRKRQPRRLGEVRNHRVHRKGARGPKTHPNAPNRKNISRSAREQVCDRGERNDHSANAPPWM